jgi:hypothetical protein
MSTDLIEGTNGIYMTRFFGGTKRGVMYQIATRDDYGVANGRYHVVLSSIKRRIGR